VYEGSGETIGDAATPAVVAREGIQRSWGRCDDISAFECIDIGMVVSVVSSG
jgi:hypothetical protein